VSKGRSLTKKIYWFCQEVEGLLRGGNLVK